MGDHMNAAIESGDLGAVRRSVAADPSSVHSRDRLGNTPLHYAVWQGRAEIARFLISSGADVDARGDQGMTPLHYAARYDEIDLARALHAAGATVDAVDDSGRTSLRVAARGGRAARRVTQFLLDAGAVVDLNAAVCLGDAGQVKAIITADPGAVRSAATPGRLITDAITMGASDVLDLLLDAGADPNGGTDGSATQPLFDALSSPRPDIHALTKLLEHGADPNLNNRAGETALAYYSKGTVSPQVVELLRRFNARG